MNHTQHPALRRILAAAGTAALVGGLLVACSAAEPSGPTTIQWWGWDPSEDGAQEYIDAFEAENPDINVEYHFYNYSDYYNALRLGATSSTGPDVFEIEDGAAIAQYAPLAEDLTARADELLQESGATLLGLENLRVGDKQAAMPFTYTSAGQIWYNKTLLDKLGLAVPTTLDEWVTTCEKIRASGSVCFVQGAKDGWVNTDVFQSIANQLDPGAFSAATSGAESFDTPAMVEAFGIWKSLFTSGIVQEGALAATEYPDANDLWLKGEAAMIALGTFNSSRVNKAELATLAEMYSYPELATTEFMPAFFPKVTADADYGTLFGSASGWGISAASAKKDAAWTFLSWLTASEEGQSIPAKHLQQPALTSVSPNYSDALTEGQVTALESFQDAIKNPVGQRSVANADVQAALWDALSSVASDQQTPEQAATAVQAAIDSAY